MMNAAHWLIAIFMGLTIGETIDVNKAGECQYWRHHHLSASGISPGASGSTRSIINTATMGWLLDATNEYLYFDVDVHSDWDPGNIWIMFDVALAGAETASDIINAEVVLEYHGNHDDIDTSFKTQTRTINHDITSDNAQGSLHYVYFELDYDLADNVLDVGDNVFVRFRLDSVAGGTDVAAVHVISGHVWYTTYKPQIEAPVPLPVEG